MDDGTPIDPAADDTARFEAALALFGVKGTVRCSGRGPTVSRYDVVGVRVEAIRPKDGLIAVEIPNAEPTSVPLSEIIASEAFRTADSALPVAIGMDVTGAPVVADLARMPHLLIGGAGRSGKTTIVSAIIESLLARAGPEEVQLILIDPKKVELAAYRDIPHLMAPVLTETREALDVLRQTIAEMERRYDLLARAVGIHLVVVTQRPSANVITGMIKANVPSRIALCVASRHDSRAILDLGGAERLAGRGDMLYMPFGADRPMRVQGALVTAEEIEATVSRIGSRGGAPYTIDPADEASETEAEPASVDALYDDAVVLVTAEGQASVSRLQRRFKIGYARAGRLMDAMEKQGIVGPSRGSRAREVLVKREEPELPTTRPAPAPARKAAQLCVLQDDQIDEVVDVWNEAMAAQGPEYAEHLLSSERLRGVIEDHNFLRSGAIVATDGEEPVGLVIGYVQRADAFREGTVSAMPGRLAGIAVKPSHWRRGIGAELLKAVEKELAGQGRTEVGFATYSVPIHLLLGPYLDTAPYRFFLSRGYRPWSHELRLANDLERFELTDDVRRRRDQLARGGVEYRFSEPDDREELLELIRRFFPGGWEVSIEGATDPANPRPVLLALAQGKIVGFMGPFHVPEPGGPSHFGSPGVDPDFRGRGIGKVMFHLGLDHLKQRGAALTRYTTSAANPARFIYFDSGAEVSGVFCCDMRKALSNQCL